MTEIVRFKRDTAWQHYDNKPLEGYIYKDVLPSNLFESVRKSIKAYIAEKNTNTFYRSATEIVLPNKKIQLYSHGHDDRDQIVMVDLSFEKDWYYQTHDTIKEWSDEKLKSKLNPHMMRTLQHIEKLTPFDSNDYVFNRIHINYLEPNKMLGLHKDGGNLIFNSKTSEIINHSVTVYLYDHIEGLGGEFWGPCGFVYKPRQNTALVVNGQQATHGVTQNISDSPRLAFTIRASHKSTLHLPGHPDKFLWDVMATL